VTVVGRDVKAICTRKSFME